MSKKNKKEKRTGGNKLYTPTRQEWLCTVLNQTSPFKLVIIEGDAMTIQYLPSPNDTDTILIRQGYTDGVPKSEVKKLLKMAKNIANDAAKNFGWDTWVKIETESEMIDG